MIVERIVVYEIKCNGGDDSGNLDKLDSGNWDDLNGEEIMVIEIKCYGGEDIGNLDKLGRIVVFGISCYGGWIVLV